MRVQNEPCTPAKVSRETLETAFDELTAKIPRIAIRQGVTAEEFGRKVGVEASTARDYLWSLVNTGYCDYEETIHGMGGGRGGLPLVIFKRWPASPWDG